MSKLTGHFEITMRALNELKAEHRGSLISGVPTRSPKKAFTSGDKMLFLMAPDIPQNPAWGSVLRDIDDVFNLGHWFRDSAQSHHFMRKFNGQSPVEAYIDALRWIRKNATEAAQWIAGTMKYAKSARYLNLFYGQPSILLGNAAHAVQDSFSQSHVTREAGTGKIPGRIVHIKLYEGREKEGEGGKDHGHFDKLWRKGKKREFSTDGRYAINATKELIWMVLGSAAHAKSSPQSAQLIGWNGYIRKWLAASTRLSAQRNFAYDFVDRFRIGARAGSGMVTFNMDESGLANALIAECGENTGQVQEVFERLYEKHGSDVDDVAKRYVKKAMGSPAAQRGLKRNKELVHLLIKSMEEGYTSDEEEFAIAYLRSLSKPTAR